MSAAEDLTKLVRSARSAAIRAAREDGAAFNEYVLRDEQTGGPITLQPMHYEWHDLMDMHDRLIVWSHLEAGKTSQISIGRSLFELGRNPALRIVILSNTAAQATKIVKAAALYIERSRELRQVFPELRPGPQWNQNAITVRRKTTAKDPSLQAAAVHGAIVGARIDRLIIDDILDWENTRTPEAREELRRWLMSEVIGRLSKNGRIVIVGNAYHPDDLLHWLASEKNYVWRRYPVANDNGESNWPEHWPADRIALKRTELGPIEAGRQLDCVAIADATQRCKTEWIRKGLTRGIGVPMLFSITRETLPPGARCFTGVDLGVKKHKRAAKTVVFTILVYEDGDRQVIGITSGRMNAIEIIAALIDHQKRYASIVMVEDNGAQAFVIDHVHDIDASLTPTVLPFHTGGNKYHPVFGVEALFAEFAAGRWIIPANDQGTAALTPEIAEWLAECMAYAPERHTGDHLMASWFAREGARMFAVPKDDGAVEVKILGAAEDVVAEDRREELEGWEPVLKRRTA